MAMQRLRHIWADPVWSKVISAALIAGFVAVGHNVLSAQDTLQNAEAACLTKAQEFSPKFASNIKISLQRTNVSLNPAICVFGDSNKTLVGVGNSEFSVHQGQGKTFRSSSGQDIRIAVAGVTPEKCLFVMSLSSSQAGLGKEESDIGLLRSCF